MRAHNERRGVCGAGGVCGVKANAGHAKPAAGMSGLLALAAGLGRGLAAPNAQLRVLNPRVGEARRGGAACALPAGLASMGSGAEGGLVGGVSSLGYSGTIAHALLQCALVAVAATGS